jgi:hypothetical protein
VNAVDIMFRGDPRQAVAAAEETSAAIRGVGETSAVTNAETGKLERGILAGSGAFRGLGRSVAYASGAFLAAAGLTDAFKGAFDESEKLEKAQRSLDAAIAHTGGNVAKLRPQYDATAKAAAQYGMSQADATEGLARATLLTGSAEKAQRAYQEALVISKGDQVPFASALTATSKAQEGITTSLQRYGIEVKKGASGQEQFTAVMGRWAGQAAANTTNLDKLRSKAENLAATLGGPLRAALNYIAGELVDLIAWLQSPAVAGALASFRTDFLQAVQPIVTWFQQNWPEIKQVIVETVQDAWTVVKDTIAVFEAGWRVFGGTIKTIVKNDFAAIVGVIQGVVKVIRGVVEIVKGIAHGDWGLVWKGIKDVVSGAIGAILAVLKGLGKDAAAILGLAAHLMWQALKAGFNDLVKLAKSLPHLIVSAIGDLSHLLWDAGKALIEGLIGGIKSMFGKLGHLAGSIGGFVKGLKGPLPKDLILLEPEGAAIMQGLMNGIAGQFPALQQLVSGIGPSLSSGMVSTPVLAGRGAGSIVPAAAAGSGGPTYVFHVTSLASTPRGVAQELGKIVRSAPRSPAISVVAR